MRTINLDSKKDAMQTLKASLGDEHKVKRGKIFILSVGNCCWSVWGKKTCVSSDRK